MFDNALGRTKRIYNINNMIYPTSLSSGIS